MGSQEFWNAPYSLFEDDFTIDCSRHIPVLPRDQWGEILTHVRQNNHSNSWLGPLIDRGPDNQTLAYFSAARMASMYSGPRSFKYSS